MKKNIYFLSIGGLLQTSGKQAFFLTFFSIFRWTFRFFYSRLIVQCSESPRKPALTAEIRT